MQRIGLSIRFSAPAGSLTELRQRPAGYASAASQAVPGAA
jgi:hypothetical protein